MQSLQLAQSPPRSCALESETILMGWLASVQSMAVNQYLFPKGSKPSKVLGQYPLQGGMVSSARESPVLLWAPLPRTSPVEICLDLPKNCSSGRTGGQGRAYRPQLEFRYREENSEFARDRQEKSGAIVKKAIRAVFG